MTHSFLGRAVRRARGRAGRLLRMPPAQLAFRGLLLLTGATALLVAPGGRLIVPGLLALVGVPALLSAVVNPDGAGPAVVLGAAGAAWALRYGVSTPPLDATLALAGALAVHHSTAALCAAMPRTSRIDPAVVLRWAGQVAVVLAVAAAVAAAARLLGRPAASVPLEIAGVAAVVALAAVAVLLTHHD
jgi:hypothetical protein